jgi:hypothetical protein
MWLGTAFDCPRFHAVGPIADLVPSDHPELRLGQSDKHVGLGHGGMIPGGGHRVQAGKENKTTIRKIGKPNPGFCVRG